MLIGYVRVSKSDGTQTLAPQRDAMLVAGVDPGRLYEDLASGHRDDRPGLAACFKAIQPATRSCFGSSTGSAATCATWGRRPNDVKTHGSGCFNQPHSSSMTGMLCDRNRSLRAFAKMALTDKPVCARTSRILRL